MDKKIFPKRQDFERPANVTPIIKELEDWRGYSQEQVIEWFKLNHPDRIVNVEIYYRAINAGKPNPLLRSIEEIE